MDPSAERRKQTKSSIYQYIYSSREFVTRQKLSQDLGLSLPTIQQYLAELMEEGLVRLSAEQQKTGGRRAQGLETVPDARIAAGIAVTDSSLRLCAADLHLHELACREISLEPVTRLSALGFTAARELERFLDDFGLDRSRLLGAGIALPAVLSPDGRQVLFAPTLPLQDRHLEDLTASMPCPVRVLNDSSAGGQAEWFVRGGSRSMAYLSLENGVGGAIMLNGVPYTGDNMRSAEFGHMCVEPGGLRCSCGRCGCLEACCSALRIQREMNIPLKEFFIRLDAHDPACEYLWRDMLRHLATAVSSIRMILDCDVVLGGFLAEHLQPWMPQLKEYVSSHSPFGSDAGFLHLGTVRNAVPLGAAYCFISEFLQSI